MTHPHADHTLSTIAELEALYGLPGERASLKQINHLDAVCQRFIAAAPFLLVATCGATGMDCSPRGDQPGFVGIDDAHTLLLPDRRGNNRIDSLRNLIANPMIGLLFLIPGVHQCLRVNGTARISLDPALLARFALDGVPPTSVLVVRVEQAFVQCSRAILRGGLWPVDATQVPGLSDLLQAQIGSKE
ncbi:pyridoxamine 5'-phosphate oxidase family protein [Actimicrobium sp. CCC2.4]|uniref:MSMEG_1061 family FMN-dependent PPOX-type flavoprotein n=1 Tax=Actimicrobium sp. CCC2.4 TaxID=3048606 RepID=UPI002AC976B5|nr:MSMEG_1061 family FMN-dependent PPOX-type flavoprotein [Actimicrobium sp. CCC2.4]MEB0136448.1 pyridoxamine 5'-phosphate oxidase family protein [Actimicrobium sp. CCC2.4]WPX30810.1 pyridoxamine 5'-phosphate oxidase family protein [Actimicrobium sp. CCC2.4]